MAIIHYTYEHHTFHSLGEAVSQYLYNRLNHVFAFSTFKNSIPAPDGCNILKRKCEDQQMHMVAEKLPVHVVYVYATLKRRWATFMN